MTISNHLYKLFNKTIMKYFQNTFVAKAIFSNKVTVLTNEDLSEIWFKMEDIIDIFFGRCSNFRITLKPEHKKKAKFFNFKSADPYVSITGLKKIILKSKLDNIDIIEERFLELCFKIKYNIQIEEHESLLVLMNENLEDYFDKDDEDERAIPIPEKKPKTPKTPKEKTPKTPKEKTPKEKTPKEDCQLISDNEEEENIFVLLKKFQKYYIRNIPVSKLENIKSRGYTVLFETELDLLKLISEKLTEINKDSILCILDNEKSNINLRHPLTEEKFLSYLN